MAALNHSRAAAIKLTTDRGEQPPVAVPPATLKVIGHQWDLHPTAVIAAFKRMRARRKKPESTPEEFASVLATAGLPNTAERLREAAELI